MRIAMIGQKGIPTIYGGIERHVEELANELVGHGHDVLVYARNWYSPKAMNNLHGIRIIHTPTIHTKHLDAIIGTLTATIHALFQKPDVIHYHGVGPSLLAWIPRMFSPKTKVVSTFHCIDRYHQKWGPVARLMLALGEKASCFFAHKTIVVSKTIKSYCLNEYNAKTNYIPNGAQIISNTKPDLVKTFGLEPQKYVVLVSRLIKHKGAHLLIDAWKNIKKTNPELIADYKLAIVGDGVFTNKYVQSLHDQIQDEKSIVMTGWQHGDTLDALFANATLLVHPSENEGLPLTVLTAMAADVPVLLSDIPEHKELVEDKNFLFENGNTKSLTEKLMILLTNANLCEEGKKVNKKKVVEEFDWHNIATQTTSLYSTSRESK